MCKLTAEEEIALRRIANQSVSVDLKAAQRLIQLKLAQRVKDGWSLTPLGCRQYGQLAQPLLRQGFSDYIGRLLDRAIPLARAAGIPRPDPVPESDEVDCREAPEKAADAVEKPVRPASTAKPRTLPAACPTAPSHVADRQIQIEAAVGDAVTRSREALNRSWMLLTKTQRMIR